MCLPLQKQVSFGPSFSLRLVTSLFFLSLGCTNLWEVGVSHPANNSVLGVRAAGGGQGQGWGSSGHGYRGGTHFGVCWARRGGAVAKAQLTMPDGKI